MKTEIRTFETPFNFENQSNTVRRTGLAHLAIENFKGTEPVVTKFGGRSITVRPGTGCLIVEVPANPTPKQMLGMGLKNPNMEVV